MGDQPVKLSFDVEGFPEGMTLYVHQDSWDSADKWHEVPYVYTDDFPNAESRYLDFRLKASDQAAGSSYNFTIIITGV